MNHKLICPSCDACAACAEEKPLENPHCAKPEIGDSCSNCGAKVRQHDRPLKESPASDSPLRARSSADRRQLTVVFCDLVGSTAIAARLDPEELGNLVSTYQKACALVVEKYEGYVAQYLGDGVLVYFGYPVAHEDNAVRAVRAGIDILAATEDLNRRFTSQYGVELAVRVGIHTGVVVVGRFGGSARQEHLALGYAPNIAARIQSLAQPNQILVGESTKNLLRGRFSTVDAGTLALGDAQDPVRLFRIAGRTDDRGATTRTAIIGRQTELRQLSGLWARAKASDGQVAFVCGEPGIGKSLLLLAFCAEISSQRDSLLTLQCSSLDQNEALHPFREMLRRQIEAYRGTSAKESSFEALRRLVLDNAPHLESEVWSIASLLNLEIEDTGNRTRATRQTRATTLVAEWIASQAKTAPLLVIWEDIHWADPSTLEALGAIVDKIEKRPILLVLTSRDFVPPAPLQGKSLTSISLGRLGAEDSAQLVRDVAGGKDLPHTVRMTLIERAGGVPLFVEELTRMLLDSGVLREDSDRYEYKSSNVTFGLEIPATLDGLLMSRLDGIPEVKSIAKIASVLGRVFLIKDVLPISGMTERDLDLGLQKLAGVGILERRHGPTGITYSFRHALLQEAAYASLLKAERHDYHRKIGEILEDRVTPITRVGTDPIPAAVLAYHWSRSFDERQPEVDCVWKAIRYLTSAADDALRVSAYREALYHTEAAQRLLDHNALPRDQHHNETELELLNRASSALRVVAGWTAERVKECYHRSLQLCSLLGNRPEEAAVLFGLWSYHLVRGEYSKSLEVAEACRELAHRLNNTDLMMEAHAALANSQFWLGELEDCVRNARRVLHLYDPKLHGDHISAYGQDPRVVAGALDVWAPWLLGDAGAAAASLEALESLVKALNHPFSTAIALNAISCLHHYRRDPTKGLRSAEALIQLSTEHEFPNYRMFGVLFRGWALAKLGRVDEVIDEIGATYEIYATQIGGLAQTQVATLVADVYGEAGRHDDALKAIEFGLAAVEKDHERPFEAELLRLKAVILFQLGIIDEAERLVHRSIHLASVRGERVHALRSSLTLLDHARQSGKRVSEAMAIVQERKASFTGDQDFEELKRADGLN